MLSLRIHLHAVGDYNAINIFLFDDVSIHVLCIALPIYKIREKLLSTCVPVRNEDCLSQWSKASLSNRSQKQKSSKEY